MQAMQEIREENKQNACHYFARRPKSDAHARPLLSLDR